MTAGPPRASEPPLDQLVFVVKEDLDGGFTARAPNETIFTQADDLPALRKLVRDAVRVVRNLAT